ncbi:MAG: hypothetical protein JNK19_04290 [Tabrizicola sp.]|nr:hypothetical protein [Tabrizicola sp.]
MKLFLQASIFPKRLPEGKMETLPRRWGILIKGHDFDLRAWTSAFQPPFDPHVSLTGHGPALWSKELQDATSSSEVWERSKPLLQLMNATMLHTQGGRLVETEGIVELDVDGNERRHHILEAKGIEMRTGFGSATITVRDANGNLVQQEPRPSVQQQWLATAAASDYLAELLFYALKRDNWFEIYKAIETLENRYGGEASFLALGWEDASKVKLLKRTANFYHRHARGKFERPKNRMDLSEANELLTRIIRRAFDEANKT